MRAVNFDEVGMENYGPYIDPMIHTFKNDHLTLLTGPNGIGKTMSLDALPFTLFGITSKKAKGDDVVNNVVGKNCKTWVKFRVDDDKYEVTRYHKYTKFGNTVILNKNGVDIMQGHREVLPEIEKLVCPQKAFMNTLMFGQKVKDFFTDLVDSDKKEIFRKILALEQYVLFYKKTDEKLKVMKNEIETILIDLKVKENLLTDTNDQIKHLEEFKKKFYEDQKKNIESYKTVLEDNQRLLNNWTLDLNELEKKSFDFETIINDLAKINVDLESLSEKYQTKISILKNQAEQKKNELNLAAKELSEKLKDELNSTQTKIKDEMHILNIQINNLDMKLKDINHNLSLEINKLKNDNSFHETRMNEIKTNVLEKEISSCPTCEQEVNEKIRNSLLEKVNKHLLTIESNEKIITSLNEKSQTSISSIAKDRTKIESQIKSLNKKYDESTENAKIEHKKITDRINQAFVKVDELSGQQIYDIQDQAKQEKSDLIIQYETQTTLKNAAEEYEKKLTTIKKIIEDVENKILLINTQIESKENESYDTKQLLTYQQKEQDLKYNINKLNKSFKDKNIRIEILQFWKSGFSSTGIPSILIDESIPFMNKKVSEYLDMLTNGRYIVSFDTLDETKAGEYRDKISVRVIDTHTRANSRVQLSGGQTRIVDIATILTLGDLQSTINDVKFNILLFDEIFDALDYDNVGYVAKVLNKLKVGKSIFVISHQHQDQLEPDDLLTLH